MNALVAGFLLSFSLILAIGSQSAFVLRQGLKAEHVFWICLVCAVSDAILIGIGVAGFSVVLSQSDFWLNLIRYTGALFLFFYGLMNFISAFKGGHSLQAKSGNSAGSLKKTLLICLAFTWLNPHVYLDTLLLIGSVSTRYQGQGLHFFIGASLASLIFFFSLGYGARLLQPLFRQARSWQILDTGTGLIMWLIAYSLL
ncbi:MAG: amino acid transporter [Alcaligenaceae bacterium]|nr:amino acid transporter [Alcaligenaceae bacterium]